MKSIATFPAHSFASVFNFRASRRHRGAAFTPLRIIIAWMSSFIAVFTVAASPTFSVDASHAAGDVSPTLYGLMTEEINHSYDGGLYAELIQNRAFLDNATTPVHWSVVGDNGAATIALDPANAFNDKLTTSLRLTVTTASKNQPAGVANSGYWGIPVRPKTPYRVSILAKADADASGPITVALVSNDGRTVYAKGKISGLTKDWKKFELRLKTGRVASTSAAHLVITLEQPGTV